MYREFSLTNPCLKYINLFKVGDKEDCHPVERIVYQDECIPYVEKICFTQNKEICKDVYDKNCTAVIDEFENRKVFIKFNEKSPLLNFQIVGFL